MEDYTGEVFTLNTGESYLILNNKKTPGGDICIGIATKTLDMTKPVELKLIETRNSGEDTLEGCLYEGDDYNELCKELLGNEAEDETAKLMKVMERLELIKTRLATD